MLTSEELLAGGTLTYEVNVPSQLIAGKDGGEMRVELKPLTVRDLQLITRAAKENDALTSALMVHTALVNPELTLGEVNALQVGLMQFLLAEVNRISGIAMTPTQLDSAVEDPLIRATFILSSEFGWTPEQVNDLTLGQIMLNLQLLKEKHANND